MMTKIGWAIAALAIILDGVVALPGVPTSESGSSIDQCLRREEYHACMASAGGFNGYISDKCMKVAKDLARRQTIEIAEGCRL